MSPYLNLRARLERANRNNHKAYSAWETFRKFKWFTLGMVILMPIYPSLSVLGSDYSAAADYDESTIITAYNDDEEMPAYVTENGFISTDFDVSSPIASREDVNDGGTNTIKKSASSEKYVVQSGDTIAKIAARYGVSTDTILWANDMEATDTLSVGMSLLVPPVSGVMHRVVAGDTISEIASRYDVDADDIVRVNNLRDAASIRKGMDLMIPGAAPKKVAKQTEVGKVPEPKKTTTPKQTEVKNENTTPSSTVVNGLKSRYTVKYTGLSRGFAWGNCTWYVAQHKTVTWRGNANQWMKNAKAAGIKTGQTPVPGAIIQFSGRGYNRYYGHVGIVADVTDDYVIVKDMNYRSLNEVTIRKIPRDDESIDGYIYVD